jgi:hypothetical protein
VPKVAANSRCASVVSVEPGGELEQVGAAAHGGPGRGEHPFGVGEKLPERQFGGVP